MGWSKAETWCTASARGHAKAIADIKGLYCGPTVVGWIAAVWNIDIKGRTYDYVKRLKDKDLFPDGPRKFFGKPVGFQQSLNDILRRETDNELRLSKDMLHKYGAIHAKLDKSNMPVIICMYPDQITLHYVTLYKSNKDVRDWQFDRIQFYWQDNGLYGGLNDGNKGLYKTPWRNVGESFFTWGAASVEKA